MESPLTQSSNPPFLSDKVYRVFDNVPFAVAYVKGPSLVIDYINPFNLSIWQCKKEDVLGRPLFEARPDIRSIAEPIYHQVYQTGQPFKANRIPFIFSTNGSTETRYFNMVVDPVFDDEGKLTGQLSTTIEVTGQVPASHGGEQALKERALAESEERFRAAVSAVQGILWTNNASGEMEGEQVGWSLLTGQSYEEYRGFGWTAALHPDDTESTIVAWNEAVQERKTFVFEHRLKMKNGDWGRFSVRAVPVLNSDGTIREWVGVHTNITEKWLAEQALRDSESRFQNLVREASVGIVLLSGPEMKVEIVNEAYGKLIERTPEELLGRELFSVIPEAAEMYLPLLQKVLYSGEPFYLYDTPYSVKKGTKTIEGYLNTAYQPYYDSEGKVTGVLALCHDITESVNAKKALQESEARFRHLAESLPIVVWTAAPDGGLTFISRQWEEDYGNPIAKSLGSGWASFVHADDIAGAAAAWNHSLQTGENYEAEFRVWHKSGTYRWTLVRAVPIVDAGGTISNWYGSNTDIEEQKRGEEKVKASEARFRTLAETLPQMIWMRTIEGDIEYASHNWERYSGIKNIREAWKWMTHPEDWSTVMTIWKEAVATQKPFRHEVRLRNKEGLYRWHHASGEPVKDESGTVLKWIGALSDIHEQKTFAEALEKEVEERTKQLAQANRELQRSNEDLQQFAHVASHDLKEPVRKVMTFSNRLRDEMKNNLSEKGASCLSKIEQSALRMYSMIDGVLLYSSLNALEQTEERVDLDELMQTIEADLEVSITEKAASIVYNDLPGIKGSPILLYQLFYNLANNALKFARENVPPVITLTSAEATKDEIIQAGLQAGEPFWKIGVADNGIGFPEAYASRIFNSFTRLHTKDRYEGTGLGLALCRKIAERHRGVIHATGKEGEGAVFTILLPAE